MTDPYLEAYDAQLRSDAETPSATAATRLGPLRLVTFAGGRGFVTYRDLGGVGASGVDALVAAALVHYRADPLITRVEWKTRGHDHAPGLHEALVAHGFAAEETESIVIGEAAVVATDRRPPDGVSLRTVTAEADVRAMSALADRVFGDPVSDAMAEALMRRLARRDGMELWVAEAGGEMVGAGRLEPVEGTEFAGVWGGVVLETWRAGASTWRSPRPGRTRRWATARGCCTATRRSTRAPSSSAPGCGPCRRQRPTAGLADLLTR